jgi:serine/threonine-protein kinase
VAPGARAEDAPPITSNPEALAAFAEGMQLFLHDCGDALPALERARQLDPSFASAALRVALLTRWSDTAASRESMQKAARFRARLRPREVALLDAKLPCMEPSPAERAGCEERLRAAADAHPADAELAFWLAEMQFEIGRLDEALASYDRALAIDPAAAVAVEGSGFVRAYRGDFDGALRSFGECLARAPSASRCLHSRIVVRELAGECRAVEADAKRMIAVAPDSPSGHRALATVAFALGEPLEASRESFRQVRARMPAERRANAEHSAEALLAFASGDFEAGIARLRALEAAVAGETSELAHAGPARLLAAALAESGRAAEASRVAHDFLARRGAWAADARFEDFALMKDPTMALLTVELRAGTVTAAELAARRAAWIDAWRAKAPPFYLRYTWPYAWAAPAESPDEARAALDALPAFEPIPAFLPLTMLDAPIGRALWLGGRRDEGRARLERATRSCRALEHPFEWMGAWLWLGRAREEAGDKAGACAAFAKVVDRWGRAKPRSLTAERAADRAKALGCAR